MPRPRSLARGQRGWTLLEMMLVVALISIITPGISILYLKMTQGMAADEMRNQLQSLNAKSLLRLHERVEGGHHLFQNDSSGASYIAAVTLGMSTTTKNNFPILTGSQLPTSQPNSGASVGSFSPVTAVRADFGNSLLFAAYDIPQTLANQPYVAPVTVSGSSITYSSAASKGQPATIVIDMYRFYYYFLSSKGTHGWPGVTPYRLVEWQSQQYADYFEINGINDGVLQTNVIKWLAQSGPASFSGGPVTWAWDPTQTSPTAAFYTLDTSGNINTYGGTVTINEAQCLSLTQVETGIISSGFGYGICPNSAGNSFPLTVPLYGLAAGLGSPFPGGFEVGISGSSGGRKILTRSALIAKGAAPSMISNDASMVHNMRDVW